jgi:glucose-6-phosphate-specific signal transduction histidine kinase
MGLRKGRLSLSASFVGVMLLLGDVYLAARYGWRGGLVIAASLAAAVMGFFAWSASAHR